MYFLKCLLLLTMLQPGALAGEIFEQRLIRIGDQVLNVEIADTPARQRQGLKDRHALQDGHGMLFVFPTSGSRVFWMHRTFLPLSIGVFDERRRLLKVMKLNAVSHAGQTDIPSFTTPPATRYALEVHQGWFEQHGIVSGNRFKFVED